MPPVTGPIDVSLSLFSGLCTELAPADLPEGVSPDNQDVMFLPGSVLSRPGLRKIFANPFANNPMVNHAKGYRQANGKPINIYMDALGVFRKEDPVNAPGVYGISFASVVAGAYCVSVTHENKEYMAFNDGVHPVDIPRLYDGDFFDRVSQDGPAVQIAAADDAAAGSISAGVHQVVMMFLTRNGYITKPSQPISWNAAGGKKVRLTNLPLGPPNVIARIFAFTGAGGDNFFTLLDNSNVGGIPVQATILPDNTSVAVTLDFNDNSLFDAEGIDIPGNDLFELVVLAPCVGVESFAGRLFWWGEYNKIQNLLNMGFEGGFYSGIGLPLGWTVAADGALVGSPVDFGFAWQITGDGSANPRGLITQPAYQDYLLNPILETNTQYSFVCWAKSSVANQQGTLVAQLYSPGTVGQPVLAQASILLNQIPNASGKFVSFDFNAPTPASIPADTILRVYAVGMTNGQTLDIDEMMIVFTAQPFRDSDFRVSYFQNPESFDGVTGDLGPESDSSPIRATAVIRETLHILTADRLHQTQDNSQEPGTWDVRELGTKCGAVSPRCVAKGRTWFVWVSQEDSDLSLMLFGGGDPTRVSQEVQPNFSAINQDAMQTIWAVNDAGSKRIYIGVPNGGAVIPNLILPLDYRELETSSDISTYGPIHIGFTGKMIASDRVRKWTVWNLPMQCGAILYRSLNKMQFCVGSGGNVGFGNVYLLDSAKLTDDDYGQIVPYYTTYFFVNHEMEQALPVGVHRKLYDKVALFVTGVGFLQITPIADRLGNLAKFTTRPGGPLVNTIELKQQLNNDIELPGEVSAERVAFKISVLPITDPEDPNYTNGTDVQFSLQHMSARMQAHPVSPLRGSI